VAEFYIHSCPSIRIKISEREKKVYFDEELFLLCAAEFGKINLLLITTQVYFAVAARHEKSSFESSPRQRREGKERDMLHNYYDASIIFFCDTLTTFSKQNFS
jgi:hypothetical protein